MIGFSLCYSAKSYHLPLLYYSTFFAGNLTLLSCSIRKAHFEFYSQPVIWKQVGALLNPHQSFSQRDHQQLYFCSHFSLCFALNRFLKRFQHIQFFFLIFHVSRLSVFIPAKDCGFLLKTFLIESFLVGSDAAVADGNFVVSSFYSLWSPFSSPSVSSLSDSSSCQ